MYWNYNKHSRKERRMLLVAECIKEKKTQEEIAEELGVCKDTVRRDIKELRYRGLIN